ncbi:MAG: phytanoyl-CoA dioxygenase family protein [Pseudomonadota bacterium]
MTVTLVVDSEKISNDLAAFGFAVWPELIPAQQVAILARRLATVLGAGGGSRAIAPDHPVVGELLANQLLADIIGPEIKPVRILIFDKTPRRNWAVAWHQDRTIAVAERRDDAAVGGWTVKNGVPHCEAPAGFLAKMLTMRWHLDPCGPAEGGLRVLPGSHRHGRLSREAIEALSAEIEPVELDLPAGSALLMRPLLVHGSSRCASASRRRVLHMELASQDPPPPLRWAWG